VEEQPIRLLVVDDDADYRAYLVALTRRLGFAVTAAPDGESALQWLARDTFDVVVADHAMPRLTGIGLIGRVRAAEATKSMYVLMLTAHDDVRTKVDALQAGFDDVLSKSMSESELVAKLTAARRLATRQRTMDGTIRELYGLASRDELTGMFNRRVLAGEVERLLADETNVTLVLFDLDDFKRINDTFGHLAGDNVLRDVGTLFHQQTRPGDMVARFGGDEFVLTVAHMDAADVEQLAERLAEGLAALRWTSGGSSFGVGVSIGIASSQFLIRPDLEQLIEAADRDLYKNKWMRKHPNERPELYEYPGRTGTVHSFTGGLAELQAIARDLQRQRKDLESQIENASSRTGETKDLVNRIEDLRRRAEETQRRLR
jgi:diguanylate cyclase (GGDEF)-like protein